MSEKINSRDFAAPLIAAGAIPRNVRRIIIDAEAGEAVKVYYDTFGHPTLLQAITPEFLMNAETIRHAEAIVVPPDEEGA